jgi:arsenite transporter
MLGQTLSAALNLADIWPAVLLVLTPLALAAVSERWFETGPKRARLREHIAWWAVPLLAVVVFLVSATQVVAVLGATRQMLIVVPLFVAFLLFSGLIAWGLAHAFRLPIDQGRTLAFSLGTRNSFVVLPLALALPVGWELVAVVIVMQSLVELFGMIFYLWWIPGRLFR